MEIACKNNEDGFTLIEFLVALVILSVGLLGLLQTLNYSIDHNMNTQLRKEAIMLADERMASEKSKSFGSILTSTETQTIKVNVANAEKDYSVVKSAVDVTGYTKNVQVLVSWSYKGKAYSHIISSLVAETAH
jgi:type IV pilus assembly protein PilV